MPDLATYASTAPGVTTIWGAGRHAPGRVLDGAARDRAARSRAAAADRRLLVDRRSPLLLARRLRRARPAARARRQPARRRRQAGRLDHHAAGGQGVHLVGAQLVAQDQGGDLRAPPRGALLASARSWRSTSTTSSSATAPTACRRRRAATSTRTWPSSTSASWRSSPAWRRRRRATRRSSTSRPRYKRRGEVLDNMVENGALVARRGRASGSRRRCSRSRDATTSTR